MVKESEAHAAEDARRREDIELRNKLDADVYATEKLLSENRDKLGNTEIEPVEAALKEAKAPWKRSGRAYQGGHRPVAKGVFPPG